MLRVVTELVSSAVVLTSDPKHPNSAVTLKGANTVLSFFTATIVEIGEEFSLDDSHIRVLYPILLDGLRVTQSAGARGLSNIDILGQWRR